MSRTDKDRPYRVREYFDGRVTHDHRHGECRIETKSQALAATHPRYHFRYCKKREHVEIECPGRASCWRAQNAYIAEVEIFRGEVYRIFERHYRWLLNAKPESYKCSRHIITINHPETPCSCDSFEPNATCTYNYDWRGRYGSGSAPRDYRKTFNEAERRIARDELNAARRDYNANGDTEIEPVIKYQRHCANWYYW